MCAGALPPDLSLIVLAREGGEVSAPPPHTHTHTNQSIKNALLIPLNLSQFLAGLYLLAVDGLLGSSRWC